MSRNFCRCFLPPETTFQVLGARLSADSALIQAQDAAQVGPAPAQCGLGGSVHHNWPWAGQPFMASALGTSDPMEVLLGNSLELSETPN